MKRLFLAILLFSTLMTLSGCLYSNITLPMDEDVNETQLGDKEGRASVYSVLWLFSWGDAGVHAAAKNGNIQNVKHLDMENYTLLFGLYSKVTTVAYGD